MGPPNPEYLKKYLRCARWTGVSVSATCVETGTYRGDGTEVFAQLFSSVHTIELSEKWHAFACERLKSCGNIVCHLGDSAEVLGRILPSISGPATFFLDAHFAGGDTAMGQEEVPLLRELAMISRRVQSDLILIDDLRLIGQAGECGSPGDAVYPPTRFDWRNITVERIAGVINRGNRTLWLCEKDRIVIFRNLSLVRAGCLKVLLSGYQFVRRAGMKIKRTVRPSGSPVPQART